MQEARVELRPNGADARRTSRTRLRRGASIARALAARRPTSSPAPRADRTITSTSTSTRRTSGMHFASRSSGRELAADERFATAKLRRVNREELHDIVREWTMRHSKWEAMEILGRHNLPAGAVFDTRDLFEHPHLLERGMVSEIDHPTRGKWKMLAPPFHMSKSRVEMTPAPLLGQHTDEVLAKELRPRRRRAGPPGRQRRDRPGARDGRRLAHRLPPDSGFASRWLMT